MLIEKILVDNIFVPSTCYFSEFSSVICASVLSVISFIIKIYIFEFLKEFKKHLTRTDYF
jgi:hypothetical protein